MTYGTVCSGIGAPEVAWGTLGWRCMWQMEIEAFPSAVLAHHYPDTPNYGDMTRAKGQDLEPVDVIIGGTPCQSFSVAGQRAGLDDPRGVLAFEFLRIACEVGARWVVWENVPGILSSDGGRDFGAIVGALGKLWYGWAYRVLDAQYCGVPQRRRRVFVVGYLGDWRRAAAVLFERESLSGHPPPRREAGEGVAGSLGAGTSRNGASTAHSNGGSDLVAACLNSGGNDGGFRTESGEHLVAPQLSAANHHARRLTPRECEALQGLPRNYTRIPWRGAPLEECPDSPRYKAIGNSMAVPVIRWIGERIAEVEQL